MSNTTERRKQLLAQATHTDNNGNLYKYVNDSLFRYNETSWRGRSLPHWSLCNYVPCTLTGELYGVTIKPAAAPLVMLRPMLSMRLSLRSLLLKLVA